jgi:hypothetical protein
MSNIRGVKEDPMHLPVTPEMAKIYQDMLVEEAQGNRLSGTAKAVRPRLRDRLLVGTGNWLIAIGKWLRECAGPAGPALSDPCTRISTKAHA